MRGAVAGRVVERVVLLGGEAGQRLEPVRVVRGALLHRPLLHGRRDGVGERRRRAARPWRASVCRRLKTSLGRRWRCSAGEKTFAPKISWPGSVRSGVPRAAAVGAPLRGGDVLLARVLRHRCRAALERAHAQGRPCPVVQRRAIRGSPTGQGASTGWRNAPPDLRHGANDPGPAARSIPGRNHEEVTCDGPLRWARRSSALLASLTLSGRGAWRRTTPDPHGHQERARPHLGHRRDVPGVLHAGRLRCSWRSASRAARTSASGVAKILANFSSPRSPGGRRASPSPSAVRPASPATPASSRASATRPATAWPATLYGETFGGGTSAFFIFQFMFCAVSLAIVWGTTLERIKFVAYSDLRARLRRRDLPAHRPLGLRRRPVRRDRPGVQDFAGSSVVHLTGATAALAALLLLGPRKGKYGPDGKPRAIPGHNMPLFGLGVLILWLGWFGFNGGSTLGTSDGRFAEVVARHEPRRRRRRDRRVAADLRAHRRSSTSA